MPHSPRAPALAAVALTALLAYQPASARDAVRKVPALPVGASPQVVTADTPDMARPRIGAERGELSVVVDRAKIIRLPERTQTVVIGNPAIADVAIQKNGVVVVTGKSYGVTNLIALDSSGSMLAESNVSVGAPSEAVLVVQRGLERQSYSCTPACQPSVILGDSTTYFSETRGQVDARNAFANSR